MNGPYVLVRILSCLLVSLAAILGGVLLLYSNIAVPDVYWVLCALTVAGLVGKDVLAILLELKRVNGGLPK